MYHRPSTQKDAQVERWLASLMLVFFRVMRLFNKAVAVRLSGGDGHREMKPSTPNRCVPVSLCVDQLVVIDAETQGTGVIRRTQSKKQETSWQGRRE